MKQIITQHGFNASYGTSGQYLGIGNGGAQQGAWSWSSTFGIDVGRVPISAPGTFRNLVLATYGSHPDLTVTALKTTVAQSVTVALASASTLGSDLVNSFHVNAGDDGSLKLTSVGVGAGFDLSYSVEFEPDDPKTSIYGVSAFSGSKTTGTGVMAGAFGGGTWSNYSAGSLSSSYSIASLTGSVTRLDLKTFAGAPGTAIWTGYLRKNLVLQDGTGGTVDTRCVMTGTDESVFSTFDLPFVPTDHVEIVVLLTGTSVGFALAQVAAGCAVVADNDFQFMFSGGTNDTISAVNPGWVWMGAEQLATPEDRAQAPVGPTGFVVKGIYVEHGTAPGVGKSWTDVVRVNQTDTAIQVVVSGVSTSASILTDVPVVDGDVLDIQLTPAGTPLSSLFYWGLALESCGPATVDAQPITPTLVPLNGITTLTVTVTGTSPFTYQWYLGASGDTSNPIGGATSASYTTPPLTVTTLSYWVRVTNDCGTDDSETAVLLLASDVTVPGAIVTTVQKPPCGGFPSIVKTVEVTGAIRQRLTRKASIH